jgi:hypothetical protein
LASPVCSKGIARVMMRFSLHRQNQQAARGNEGWPLRFICVLYRLSIAGSGKSWSFTQE